MSNEEFKAPDWVSNNEKEKEITEKQKRLFTFIFLISMPFCMWAGWYEFGRAQNGNWRAWVYTFEWPFFGGVAFYLWRRMMRGDMPRIPRPNLSELEQENDGKNNQ